MSIVVRIWLSEQLHHHPRVHVLRQQESGGGVPAVVQPDVADAGLLFIGNTEPWLAVGPPQLGRTHVDRKG
jgi:hypothetical protein